MSFSFLKRYEAQKAYYDAYKRWQDLSPEAKQNSFAAITDETKRAKPEREIGFISPFNQVGTGLKYIRLRVLSPTQTGEGTDVGQALANMLGNYYINAAESAPTGGAIDVPRYKCAKLSLTSRSSFTKRASRITTRQYMKPDVNTVSAPFGQASGGQSYAAAAAAIQPTVDAWVEAAVAPAKRSYKFTPEG
ncbi:hypothetical protein WJM97_22320 [Okeanomitos corallinicola TIOX110]|uniref:Uncharacterized protein n=1 Tax=Okeanomitos corallinicola TIOX110 TaxID=3133117 RepID=A0ABZ2USU8_9CYAN